MDAVRCLRGLRCSGLACFVQGAGCREEIAGNGRDDDLVRRASVPQAIRENFQVRVVVRSHIRATAQYAPKRTAAASPVRAMVLPPVICPSSGISAISIASFSEPIPGMDRRSQRSGRSAVGGEEDFAPSLRFSDLPVKQLFELTGRSKHLRDLAASNGTSVSRPCKNALTAGVG